MTYLITILAYLIFLFAFGLRIVRRLKKKEDFLVAGRTLTAPILVGTLLATCRFDASKFSKHRLRRETYLLVCVAGWKPVILRRFCECGWSQVRVQGRAPGPGRALNCYRVRVRADSQPLMAHSRGMIWLRLGRLGASGRYRAPCRTPAEEQRGGRG